MRTTCKLSCVIFLALVLPLLSPVVWPSYADDKPPGRDADRTANTWTKKLDNRPERGKLHDAAQNVRGDTGKWNEDPQWQHLPPTQQKPKNVSLDDWSEQLLEQEFELTSNDDNWLLLRTRQLNDNDRVWVTQIERQGSEFIVIVNEAVWQGRYQKNFTYYTDVGVNLGKLEPGKYTAKLILQPLVFNKFEDPGKPQDNWPQDERPAEKKPAELRVAFTIVAPP